MTNRSKKANPDFAKTLKALREMHGLTQAQVSKLVHKSESTVRMWELRNSEPDHSTLIQLSDYFGVSVDYLIGHKIKNAIELTEEDKNAGFSSTKKISITPDEDDMLYVYREIGNNLGKEAQKAYLSVGKNMVGIKD